MSSTIELAVKNSRHLENLLETRMGASGRGLHQKISSIQSSVDPKIVKKVRWIATLRNKAVHEEGFEIQDVQAYQKACDEVEMYIERNSQMLNDSTFNVFKWIKIATIVIVALLIIHFS